MKKTYNRKKNGYNKISILLRGLKMSGHHSDQILTPEQAHEKSKNKEIILIDIRQPKEWQETGVSPYAHTIEMNDSDFLGKVKTLTNSNKDIPLAIICAAGGRSARVCEALQ